MSIIAGLKLHANIVLNLACRGNPYYSRPSIIRASVIQTLDYPVSIISLVLKIEKLAVTCSCACTVVVGGRKLWGTRSNVSVELVREKIQGKLGSDESIEVVKVVREGARFRWWFWLKGKEDVLLKLDDVELDG